MEKWRYKSIHHQSSYARSKQSASRTGRLNPGQTAPSGPTEQKAGRVPELFRSLWSGEKSLAPTEIRTTTAQLSSL